MSVLAITKQINIMPQLLFCCMTLASRPGHDSETQLIMQYKSWCRERGLLLQRSIHLFVSGFCWPCLPSPPFPTSFCCFFPFICFLPVCLYSRFVYSHFLSLSPFFTFFYELLSRNPLPRLRYFLQRGTKKPICLTPKKKKSLTSF